MSNQKRLPQIKSGFIDVLRTRIRSKEPTRWKAENYYEGVYDTLETVLEFIKYQEKNPKSTSNIIEFIKKLEKGAASEKWDPVRYVFSKIAKPPKP